MDLCCYLPATNGSVLRTWVDIQMLTCRTYIFLNEDEEFSPSAMFCELAEESVETQDFASLQMNQSTNNFGLQHDHPVIR